MPRTILALVLAALLTACGGGDDPDAPPPPDAQVTLPTCKPECTK